MEIVCKHVHSFCKCYDIWTLEPFRHFKPIHEQELFNKQTSKMHVIQLEKMYVKFLYMLDIL